MKNKKDMTMLKIIMIFFIIFIIVYSVIVINKNNKKVKKGMKEENRVVYIDQNPSYYEYDGEDFETKLDKNMIVNSGEESTIIDGNFIIVEDNITRR